MRARTFLLLASFYWFVVGCVGQSPQVTYYHLNTMETPSSPVTSLPTETPLSIGVGPVSFPEVLDRPQMVTRTDLNRYRIDEFHRWGGSLQEEFSRFFAENLAALLATERVSLFPWEKHFEPRYRIHLSVIRFDGRLGESANLEARWTITDSEGRQTLGIGKYVIEKSVAGDGYPALVKGLDQTLKSFSEEIAAEIQRLEKNRPSL